MFSSSAHFFSNSLMKHKEIVNNQEECDETEPEDISLEKRIQSISSDTQEKEEMEKGEYPVEHFDSRTYFEEIVEL